MHCYSTEILAMHVRHNRDIYENRLVIQVPLLSTCYFPGMTEIERRCVTRGPDPSYECHEECSVASIDTFMRGGFHILII